ncbi:MAG: hypothetical protein JXJ17_12095 [Anaerolineae bacterium]|nr:hypothetical protein [Anaerolineae bacterium]
MLEGLDDIQWDQLEHAYGTAEDVPDKVRALLSHKEAERRWAQESLIMGVLHQGSVYSSTAHLVQFLIELLHLPGTPDRAWLLEYLANIAGGAYGRMEYLEKKHDHVMQDYIQRLKWSEIRARQEIARELNTLAMAKQEVQKGIDYYIALLDDRDEAMRLAATGLLLNCREYHPQINSRFSKIASSDPSPLVRSLCLLGLGITRSHSNQVSGICDDEGESNLVRMAAAFSLVITRAKSTSMETIAILSKLIVDQPESLGKLHGLHQRFMIYFEQEYITHYLHALDVEAGESIISPLTELYVMQRGYGFLLETLLQLAFGDQLLSPDATVDALQNKQREVLDAIVQREDMWQFSGNMDFALQDIGLFCRGRRNEMVAFLEGKRPARLPQSNMNTEGP